MQTSANQATAAAIAATRAAAAARRALIAAELAAAAAWQTVADSTAGHDSTAAAGMARSHGSTAAAIESL